jgi:Mg2+-importing ATPase
VPATERDLLLRGFLRFRDPPRAEARELVAQFAALGIELKILTGDSRHIAQYLAGTVGMTVTGVLSGTELQALSNEALLNAADRTNLFVEVEPHQKERILLALKKRGHSVGFLGDGINDAPALHAADVGISVDSAADVAKEAADMVLLRHDLGVLKRGVEAGRTTLANTEKYLFSTTSANFGNMLSMAGLSFFLPFLPLLPKQILLNNFLSDLPAMAISEDNVDPEHIARPQRWNIRTIRNFMLVFGTVSSVFDFLTFGLLLVVFRVPPEAFRTGWFVESLLTELCVALSVRTRLPFYRSRPGRLLLWSTIAVSLFALFIPYMPGVGALGFVPLSLPVLGSLVGVVILYVAAVEILKRRYRYYET